MNSTTESPSSGLLLWLRAETRLTERRAPLVPADVRELVVSGAEVVLERSERRIFADDEYAAAGARLVEPGAWVTAPADAIILGLKELPDQPAELRHRHLFFGHAYKGQGGAPALLARFARGGGTLLDLEYLNDDRGRRLTAFGYWAGYVGASLAALHFAGQLAAPLRPLTKPELDEQVARAVAVSGPRVLVLGALGRCGTGARDALAQVGVEVTSWDLEQTRLLDRAALLDHDVVVNTVLTGTPAQPYLAPADLLDAHRLSLLVDVTCDVGSACTLFPLYDETTTWVHPVVELASGNLDVIAIDNLPSLLPREASVSLSADLRGQLPGLSPATPPWQRCIDTFEDQLAHHSKELSNV